LFESKFAEVDFKVEVFEQALADYSSKTYEVFFEIGDGY
jgi:hypothetical protein